MPKASASVRRVFRLGRLGWTPADGEADQRRGSARAAGQFAGPPARAGGWSSASARSGLQTAAVAAIAPRLGHRGGRVVRRNRRRRVGRGGRHPGHTLTPRTTAVAVTVPVGRP